MRLLYSAITLPTQQPNADLFILIKQSHTSRGTDAEGSVRVHRNGRLRCHSASWQTHQIRVEEKRFPSLSDCVFKLRFISTTPPRSLPLSSAYFTISTNHKTTHHKSLATVETNRGLRHPLFHHVCLRNYKTP